MKSKHFFSGLLLLLVCFSVEAQLMDKLKERAKEKGIESVVFDRNGFLYHGRVKALSSGAREAGPKF